jgi:tetratricopeptide (TPR) repeat protein/SAM-dependent methyltransferase
MPQNQPPTSKKTKNSAGGRTDFFAQAVGHHQAGRLDEAELLYRQMLSVDARHADSLNMLGIVACQRGDLQRAVEMINKAIALNDVVAEFHSNLGIVLMYQGRHDEAIASYEKAIVLKPEYPEALYNLGNALMGQGRHDEAVVRYEQALAIMPDFPQALSNLGSALRDQGKLDEAIARFEQALAIMPDFPQALSNLGNALKDNGEFDGAVARYEQALAIMPDYSEALDNLGIVLFAQEKIALATNAVLHALQLKETQENRMLFCECLKYFNEEAEYSGNLDILYDLAVRALTEAWIRPKELALSCLSLVLARGQSLQGPISRATNVWHGRFPESIEPGGVWGTLAGDRLLLCLLKSTTIPKIEFERFLTCVRFAMLDFATKTPLAEADDVLDCFCSVAQQCFINEYVFALMPNEVERAGQMREGVVAALEAGTSVSLVSLAVVAAYFPLHSLPLAGKLLQGEWPPAVRDLLRQQVEAFEEEARLRNAIPRLTPIEDTVSSAVQAQYEQNPYPQWTRMPPSPEMVSMDAFLHREFPMASFRNLKKTGEIDILVAGCGTGQHSIQTAQSFPRSRVLAIDLSLASLGYAKRKTEELGIRNIEYAQADILQLGTLGRTFDVIESVGTLMCLREPMAGWKILLSLLRPGGFMRIGLYSELARECVVAARDYIAEKGYQGAVAEDIRQCRQDIMSMENDARMMQLVSLGDFYTMSECRDLIFHVQEHRHTIPRIKEDLKELDLDFIGFSLEPRIARHYETRFPEDPSMTNLDLWHIFETENPHVFTGLYEFWLQKPA